MRQCRRRHRPPDASTVGTAQKGIANRARGVRPPPGPAAVCRGDLVYRGVAGKAREGMCNCARADRHQCRQLRIRITEYMFDPLLWRPFAYGRQGRIVSDGGGPDIFPVRGTAPGQDRADSGGIGIDLSGPTSVSHRLCATGATPPHLIRGKPTHFTNPSTTPGAGARAAGGGRCGGCSFQTRCRCRPRHSRRSRHAAGDARRTSSVPRDASRCCR